MIESKSCLINPSKSSLSSLRFIYLPFDRGRIIDLKKAWSMTNFRSLKFESIDICLRWEQYSSERLRRNSLNTSLTSGISAILGFDFSKSRAENSSSPFSCDDLIKLYRSFFSFISRILFLNKIIPAVPLRFGDYISIMDFGKLGPFLVLI
jgi:hypothetical protein